MVTPRGRRVRLDGRSSGVPPSHVPCVCGSSPGRGCERSVHAAPLVSLTLPSDGEQSNVIVFIGEIKYIYQLWNPQRAPSGNPAGRGLPGRRHLRRVPTRRGGAAAHPARRQRADPGARGVARREALRARPARLRPLRGGARLPPPRRAAPPGRGARAAGGPPPPATGGRPPADPGGGLGLALP